MRDHHRHLQPLQHPHSRKNRCFGIPKIRGFFLISLFLGLQGFWWTYDRLVTSQVQHKPPRLPRKVVITDSTPLSPFYNEPYQGPTRVFPAWQHPFPCRPLVLQSAMAVRSSTPSGFLYVKEMKTGSTTLSGVTVRIARNAAHRMYDANETQACTSRFVHMRARRLYGRNPATSFLWSVIREPTARMLSKYFHFGISREGQALSLTAFQKYLRSNEVTDLAYYFKSLTMRSHLNPYRADMFETEFLPQVLQAYNFLGVSERIDESLVVLQLLLGLETQDILYLSTKASGTYEYFPAKQACIPIQKQEPTMEMREWMYNSEDFESYVAADVLVYRSVNASLDLTIEELGKEQVDRALRRFQWAQRLANEKCAATTRFPCSDTGERQEANDCLVQDVACGYQCLDQVGHELADNTEFQKLPV